MYKSIFFGAFSFLLIQQQIFAFPSDSESEQENGRNRRNARHRSRSRSLSEERKEDHAERRNVQVRTSQQLHQHLSQPISQATSLTISDQSGIGQLRMLAFTNPTFFRNLEHLDLSGQCLVMHSDSQIYGGLDWRLLFSMNFDRLKSLNLSATDIGDYENIIQDLSKANFPELKSLNLSDNALIGMFYAFSENNLKNTLEEINLSGTQMQDDDLEDFLKGSWKNLRSLNLSGNDFSYHQVARVIGSLRDYQLDSIRTIDLSYAIQYIEEDAIQEEQDYLKELIRDQNLQVVLKF